MKILGIESSGLVASVAVAEDGVLLGEYTTNYKKTHSQTLLPMLDELRRMTELDLSSIDAIAISAGPGSFTGLRIGSATAKGLGLALDKPLVEVPTLEGLAYNLFGCEGLICPIMDARRNQVYTGIYKYVYGDIFSGDVSDFSSEEVGGTSESPMTEDEGNRSAERSENSGRSLAEVEGNYGEETRGNNGRSLTEDGGNRLEKAENSHGEEPVLKTVMAQTAMDVHELMKELESINQRVTFLGDGVPVYGEVIRRECAVPFSFAPAHLNAQRAGSIVALGEVYYAQGRTISSDEHGPEYLRKSQAEREKEERAEHNIRPSL